MCVCVCVCVCCVCVCVRACVYAVSKDTILCFINTLMIIIITLLRERRIYIYMPIPKQRHMQHRIAKDTRPCCVHCPTTHGKRSEVLKLNIESKEPVKTMSLILLLLLLI